MGCTVFQLPRLSTVDAWAINAKGGISAVMELKRRSGNLADWPCFILACTKRNALLGHQMATTAPGMAPPLALFVLSYDDGVYVVDILKLMREPAHWFVNKGNIDAHPSKTAEWVLKPSIKLLTKVSEQEVK